MKNSNTYNVAEGQNIALMVSNNGIQIITAQSKLQTYSKSGDRGLSVSKITPTTCDTRHDDDDDDDDYDKKWQQNLKGQQIFEKYSLFWQLSVKLLVSAFGTTQFRGFDCLYGTI